MRKALTGVVILAFAGMIGISILAVFSGTTNGMRYINGNLQHPYFLAY